jgi:hypothetical protein
MEALKKATLGNPHGRWWIKADGCDVRKGLLESVRQVWSGDEDLGDGFVQQLFEVYWARRWAITAIGSPKRLASVALDVKKVCDQLQRDLEFLTHGMKSANEMYSKALEEKKSSEQTMMELSWNSVGLEELLKKALGLQTDLNRFLSGDKDVDLMLVKAELLGYVKGLLGKQRVAATHLLVFMIADELRNHKPYAIPVSFMPYKSLTDAKLRELEGELEDVMRSVGKKTNTHYQ